ncbi:MAG: hypothetical protein EHM12_00520 [Dehalococcoidia bacterium]|nr:MAG: hypothetical protein EHM12_00520 [Dehalococcoidia bacterium]
MNVFNMTVKSVLALAAVLFSMQLACAPSVPQVMQPNHVPVIEKINYAKDVFANNENEIVCLASDADGDNLTYKWTCESGSIRGDGTDVLWMPPGKLGTYPVIIVVSDGKGGEAKETINIRVLTNEDGTADPTIEIKLKLGESQPVVIDKQRARIWTTTNIICSVENAEGNQLTYTWSSNGGKITGKGVTEGKADRIGWTAPGVSDDRTIIVEVMDSQGRQAKGLVNIHVFCCGN